VDGIMHDDFRIHGYLMKPVRVRLTLQFDADFADIFELRTCELQPRLTIQRDADACGGVLTYERADFRRALRLQCRANTGVPTTVGAMLAYEIDVEPGREWVCCVEAVPEIGRSVVAVSTDAHGPEALPVEPNSMMLRTSPILEGPFETGRVDLRSLAITDGYATYVAAGIPWFLTLFGRDTLMVGLMASLEGLWMARGALEAVGSRQAVARD